MLQGIISKFKHTEGGHPVIKPNKKLSYDIEITKRN